MFSVDESKKKTCGHFSHFSDGLSDGGQARRGRLAVIGRVEAHDAEIARKLQTDFACSNQYLACAPFRPANDGGVVAPRFAVLDEAGHRPVPGDGVALKTASLHGIDESGASFDSVGSGVLLDFVHEKNSLMAQFDQVIDCQLDAHAVVAGDENGSGFSPAVHGHDGDLAVSDLVGHPAVSSHLAPDHAIESAVAEAAYDIVVVDFGEDRQDVVTRHHGTGNTVQKTCDIERTGIDSCEVFEQDTHDVGAVDSQATGKGVWDVIEVLRDPTNLGGFDFTDPNVGVATVKDMGYGRGGDPCSLCNILECDSHCPDSLSSRFSYESIHHITCLGFP